MENDGNLSAKRVWAEELREQMQGAQDLGLGAFFLSLENPDDTYNARVSRNWKYGRSWRDNFLWRRGGDGGGLKIIQGVACGTQTQEFNTD